MHYVRLLRPPTVEQARSHRLLKISLTITTDLGDAYLSPQEPVELAVVGAYKNADGHLVPVILTQNASPKWRAGMRALKFDLQLPSDPISTIQIRPTNRQLTALATSDVYPAGQSQGLIMGVYADLPPAGQKPSEVCFRSLRLVGANPDPAAAVNALQVEEDFGDSIARHIWDGGVVTLSLVADLCLTSADPSRASPMPLLSGVLGRQHQELNILELGCGVGVVGIGLLRILKASGHGPNARILMTDLPEAKERAQANVSRYLADSPPTGDGGAEVEFESLDWQDGKVGVFGEKAQSRSWDLLLVSECTYNTDTLLALVQTLSAIHAHSARKAGGSHTTKIFLATKPRHSSEREAFDMFTEEGWAVEEKTVVPLPVLYGNAQSVEMYLLSRS
ncbi:putative methyltransferase-domain-containing protein [Podospora aff. communis PSN243]|uniref:Methyltransferase-domain-containing protein n=1 Tax=Podospora aff. communis PSN243 TaxID=3040156 RepID=A0AAV9GXD7_9PEZI|nr:putative methyltransferase-domain-containing protein [Podospora aff. communis PSN243]